MVLHGYPQTSAKLANGESVFRNDHIYVSPPWSDRDGTPYMIARIIEFLPPNATPRKGAGGRPAQSSEMQVRLSLYYRPSDISGRNVSDFRLLLAAIHTDVQPLSHIRGKCYVRHKDRIEDLLQWKKMPDRFYFVRFFDPYIKREFEVIRTEAANNIPQNVKETLMTRYEYLVTEREMVSDLTDSYRSCCVCTEWASSQDSIRCESCKNIYHMHCLNPPLLNKPAKGYSWFCIPCSLQRHKDVQDKKFHFGGAAVSGGKAGKGGSSGAGTPGSKEKNKSVTGPRGDISYRGWPYRYFGQYTFAQDTLDPDDPIFPKAATRVGPRFQANVPSWEEQQDAVEAARRNFGESSEAGPSRHIAVERGHDLGERKNESTITILCQPSGDLNNYMSVVESLRLPVPPYDTERLDMAAKMFRDLGRDEALKRMTSLKYEDYKPIIFSDKETAIFAADLETSGGLDVLHIAKKIKRSPAEILRFSYIYENKQLKIENDALRAHTKVSAHARKGQTQSQTLGAPSLGRIRARDDGDDSDGEGSVFNDDLSGGGKLKCAACQSRESRVWWRCPKSITGNAMCENCGTNYRKYGVIAFKTADDSKKADKKDIIVLSKKGKGESASGTSTPIPVAAPKLPPCVCCRRMEPKSTMARCKTCTFSVHSGCYGIASQDMGPEWECELCLNVKQEDNHLEPRCVLCPRDTSSLITKIKTKKAPADFDYLSALKPTEGRRWVHILCSAWMTELIYTNPSVLKSVEGIANLPVDRWSTVCTLCNQLDGAVIYCTDCEIPFHPSCGYQSGYKFGFEFSLAKPGKREQVTIAKFKEGTGVMNPGCWCKAHDLEGRTIYDSHEIEPEQNETALQVYAASYKSLPLHDDTFALLRKARRLDHVLLAPTPIVVTEPSCASCDVDVSPMWHTIDNPSDVVDDRMEIDGEEEKPNLSLGKRKRVCHLCWFKSRR